MVNELQLIGIRTVLVDTGREMVFYARASSKELLEDLCSAYDIGGILVQISAIYDQVVQTELVAEN